MDITRGQLLRGSALAGLAAATLPPTANANTSPRRQTRWRGVGYDVSSGESPQTGWRAHQMRTDLKAIAKDLHANTIHVFGDGVERLDATATEAAERDLTVFLQPRLATSPRPPSSNTSPRPAGRRNACGAAGLA